MMNANEMLVSERLQLDEAAAIAVTALILTEGMDLQAGIEWVMDVLNSPAHEDIRNEVRLDMRELLGDEEDEHSSTSFHYTWFDSQGVEAMCA